MSFTEHEVEFTKHGRVFQNRPVEKLLVDVPTITDLFVICHGWNNHVAEARKLYDAFFASVQQVLGAGVVKGLEGRSFGVLRVFWPSKKFADKDLIPGGGAALATQENDEALMRMLEEMKRDPERLGGDEVDPVKEENLTEAQKLLPKLQSDPQARRDFVFRLRSILDASQAHADDGSTEFFTVDPEQLFRDLDEPVLAPGATGGGGATSVADAGGAAGLGDLLEGIQAAARRIANYTTYSTMKERAGMVGRVGLAQTLQLVRARNPKIRLHLIGHSFGGRLVTAAAHALPPATPRVTVTLLQAAYSHNGLAEKFDGTRNGVFRDLLSEKRASGPILITHTKNDRAVGVAYPLASRFSRDKAAALGDENDPYGGMGRNGAQATPEAKGVAADLLALGESYSFAPGKVYNLKADQFIHDHGDVTGPQVAYALLTAVAAV